MSTENSDTVEDLHRLNDLKLLSRIDELLFKNAPADEFVVECRAWRQRGLRLHSAVKEMKTLNQS